MAWMRRVARASCSRAPTSPGGCDEAEVAVVAAVQDFCACGAGAGEDKDAWLLVSEVADVFGEREGGHD
jgi:hypothetical protein